MADKKSGSKKKVTKTKRTAKKKTRGKKAAAQKATPNLSLIAGGGSGVPLPDRRAIESMMSSLFGGATASPDGGAQDLMYEAWETSDRRKRLALARKALSLSADCADAYVLLAEEAAASPDEAIDYYRQGVAAGERSIGAEMFEDAVGHFWGILETRPYMRARAGLARGLWTAGQHDAAIDHYRDMLRLNPGDNQGLRYTLLACLMDRGRDDEAVVVLKQYEDDGTAAWAYATALLHFRTKGDTAATRTLLQEAMTANAHVPRLLLGKKTLPSRLPDYIGVGDENEAVSYVADNLAAWQKTPGALEWLRSTTEA